MPSKQDIIDYVADYEPGEIAQYIREGVVSFDELCKEPDFYAPARKKVENLLEESDWQDAVVADKEDGYDRYLQSYPAGKHRDEAIEAKRKLSQRSALSAYPDSSYASEVKDSLSQLSRDVYSDSSINHLKQDIYVEENIDEKINIINKYINGGKVSVDQLYSEIKKDHNLLSSKEIDKLESAGIIDFLSLEKQAGIKREFLEFITNNKDSDSKVMGIHANPIDSVGAPTTEVYFWGIPSSGKTCALGAIMSEARHGSYIDFAEPNNKCQGYHYMTMLSQIFDGDTQVFKLPEGTQTDAIFEMGYVFKKQKTNYPVTFIDLAGETIHSMYKQNAKLGLGEQPTRGLEVACRLLKDNAGVNRKIHFFVLEYNGHMKKYNGLTQDTLLTGAMTFIKDTGIFVKETDAIFLMVTKSDLTGAVAEEERNELIAQYLEKHYKQFYNGLRSVCVENEINDGHVDVIPFSIGDVCFKNLCLFDNTTARTVVELIMSRAKGFGKKGIIWKIFRQ